MMLHPIGHRVLVKPEKAPEQTESGLHLVEHAKPEQLGTVMSIGDSPYRGQVVTLLDVVARLCAVSGATDAIDDALSVAGDIRRSLGSDDDLAVDDLVVFSWTAGQEIVIDGERYLMLKRDDILGVVEDTDE